LLDVVESSHAPKRLPQNQQALTRFEITLDHVARALAARGRRLRFEPGSKTLRLSTQATPRSFRSARICLCCFQRFTVPRSLSVLGSGRPSPAKIAIARKGRW
jgi:hypothetical protein